MQVISTKTRILHVIVYILLILCTALMVLPFLWMLSASLKLDKDVFTFPIQWIPKHPRWQNYKDIWTEIPLLTFVKNTVKLTLIVTLLQLFTSSFAAYAFSKLQFKGRNALFLGYIATIAMPWQVYMVPAVRHDEQDGVEQHPPVDHLAPGVLRFRRVHDEAVLLQHPHRVV
ncbi:MAG: hypothetical protein LKE28_01890 [Sphaerochaeta sp.]|jgi:multiple sugar transport system permease protein|nr:hypothetical protein [Sphaerochaeta sp.]